MTAKMIFIEGTDRSGKGSLMQAIHKATNYKHVIFELVNYCLLAFVIPPLNKIYFLF